MAMSRQMVSSFIKSKIDLFINLHLTVSLNTNFILEFPLLNFIVC